MASAFALLEQRYKYKNAYRTLLERKKHIAEIITKIIDSYSKTEDKINNWTNDSDYDFNDLFKKSNKAYKDIFDYMKQSENDQRKQYEQEKRWFIHDYTNSGEDAIVGDYIEKITQTYNEIFDMFYDFFKKYNKIYMSINTLENISRSKGLETPMSVRNTKQETVLFKNYGGNSSHKIIGEGSYGCVIKPSLKCSNKSISYKNKVSKAMLSKEAVKELGEYAIISKIDKKKDFYLGEPVHCKIKKTKKAINTLENCKNLKKKYFKNKSVKKSIQMLDLLVMEDGGTSLEKVSNFIDQLEVNNKNTLFVQNVWKEMRRLFLGVLTFQKYNIVHHDIKPQNIVYNISTHRVNFIDFGHMRNMSTIFKKCFESSNFLYEYPFWNYPLEIEFLNKKDFMKYASLPESAKSNYLDTAILNFYSKKNTKFSTAFSVFMEYIGHNKTDAEKIAFMTKYFNGYKQLSYQIVPNNYENFLKKSAQTVDVYGLGLSIFYLLNCSRKFLNSQFIEEMEQCCYMMTTENPQERYYIHEAFAHFEKAHKQF